MGGTGLGSWKNGPFWPLWPGLVFQLFWTYRWVPHCNPWLIMTQNSVRIWEKKNLVVTLSHFEPRPDFMKFWPPSRDGPFLISAGELRPALSAPSSPISGLTTTRNRLLGNPPFPRNGPSKSGNFRFFTVFLLFGHSAMDPCTIRGQNAQNFMLNQMTIHVLQV